MTKKILDILQSCSKDDSSCEQLRELFEELSREKQRVEESLELLERSIRNDYDSILITELELEEPGPKIVYVNDGFTRITGYDREEVLGKTPRILQGPKTDKAVLEKLKTRLLEGNSFFGHTVNYRKDGSEFVNQWDIHPLTDEHGEVTHWVSFQHDITERKRSEAKIMDTGVEFDNLVEESLSILADIDEEGQILSANKAFRTLTGFDEEELKELGIRGISVGESAVELLHAFDTEIPKGLPDREFEVRLKKHNGEEIDVKARTRLLRAGREKRMRISFGDRARQKRIMKILEKRTAGFKRVFEKKSDFRYKVVRDDRDGFQLTYVADSFSAVTGLIPGDVSGVTVNELVHEDDLNKVEKHYEKAFSGNADTEIFRIRTRSGEYVTMIDYVRPVPDDKGRVTAVKGFSSLEVSSEKK